MITAVFTDNSDYTRATGLWQWDYGQKLRIEGLTLPTAVEIHFALTEQSGDAITRVGTTKDGVTEVAIPDSLLENQAVSASYEIYAWIYLADKTSGETVKRISVWVKCRPKPEGFDAPGDAELFRDAIAQVNASADRAEAAREGAEAAKKAAEATAGKIEGEIAGAGQIAEQVKQDAAAVAKDKQAVSQMVTETTQNAQKAAESVQAAENSSTAAKEAQKAAETAEAGATAVAEEVERDRTEVSNTHRLVEQMRDTVSLDRRAVAADRQAVENTASQFEQTAQNALTAVGQAQEAAVGAVSAEGQRQTTAVQQAGTQAVSDVETAKTEAVQAVTTEGDTQTNRVQDAAAGIVADREQIAANKQAIAGKIDKQQGAENAGKALVVGADGNVELRDAQTKTDPTLTQSGQAADAQATGREIATLRQKKADAIVETVQGEIMTLTDSSDKLFEGLRVFGKSMQDGVPSVENPVPIVNAGESGNITVEVGGKNLLTGRLYFINYSNDVSYVCNENEVTLPYTPSKETLGIGYVVPCKPGMQYTFSVTNPNKNWYLGIVEYENFEQAKSILNKIGYQYGSERSSIKYTAVGNGVLVCAIAGKWTDGETTIHECTESELLQLEYGDVATPYEPYRAPQLLTLQTPNGLPGVPVDKDGNYTDKNSQQWICDEIDLARGKYVQRIGHNANVNDWVDMPGNQDIEPTTSRFALNIENIDNYMYSPCICNRLSYAKVDSYGTEGTYVTINEPACKRIFARIEGITSLEDFTAAIPDLEVIWLLETPIETDLTAEEIAAYKALRTYSPTTVITNDAGAGMEVAYVADTKAYIDKKFKELNQAIVNTQIALL